MMLEEVKKKPEEFVKNYFKDPEGKPLVLASYQARVLRDIFSSKKRRFILCAATQSGKSEIISVILAVVAVFFPNEVILNVSRTQAQANIIFERTKAHLVEDHKYISDLVDYSKSRAPQKKEFSKTRLFMFDGNEFRSMSTGVAQNELAGEKLLGFGCTTLSIDESPSIPDKVYKEKLLRVLGSRGKLLLESGTPHHRNHFYKSWHDPSYTRYHVNWKQAVKEGRLNKEFVLNQKRIMTATQFQMWYEAEFPSQAEDALFNLDECERNLIKPMDRFFGKRILGVDVAAGGGDFTVFTSIDYCRGVYRVREIEKKDVRDTMEIVGLIVRKHKKNKYNQINVDDTGIGGGIVDRLNELELNVFGFVAGSTPVNSWAEDTCANLKAEHYVLAKKFFEKDKLRIIPNDDLLDELGTIKTKFESDGKLRILKPDKSPDHVDSLVIGLYKGHGGWVPLDDKEGVIF